LAAIVIGGLALLWMAAAFSQEPSMGADGSGTLPPCISCHVEAHPGEGGSVKLRSCSRHTHTDKLPPISTKNAPDVFILDQLSEIYVPVVFPHRLHAEMETMSNGCSGCHHHSQPDRIQPCRECHPIEPDQTNLRKPGLKGAYHRQCFGCHREWDRYTQCGICHAKRSADGKPEPKIDTTDITGRLHPNIKAPDKKIYDTGDYEEGSKVFFQHKEHSEVFGVRCSECHKNENCSRCHEEAQPAHKRERQDPHEECAKCHAAEEACGKCHLQQEPPPFDHTTRAGFELKPYHGAVACQKCHAYNDGKMATQASRECAACHKPDWHPEGFDHGKTGLQLDDTHKEAECKDCHVEGMGHPARCNACHEDDWKYPAKTPGKKL